MIVPIMVFDSSVRWSNIAVLVVPEKETCLTLSLPREGGSN